MHGRTANDFASTDGTRRRFGLDRPEELLCFLVLVEASNAIVGVTDKMTNQTPNEDDGRAQIRGGSNDHDPFGRLFNPLLEPLQPHRILVRFILGVLLSVFGAVVLVFTAITGETEKWWQLLLLIIWTVGVPAYFAIEYVSLISKEELRKPHVFEEYKYGVDVAMKIWVAIAAILVFVFHVKLGG
jgi:hypothetical protein